MFSALYYNNILCWLLGIKELFILLITYIILVIILINKIKSSLIIDIIIDRDIDNRKNYYETELQFTKDLLISVCVWNI